MKLTSKQNEVLNAIKDLFIKKGESPTYNEVKERLGYKSISSLQVHVKALKNKGYLSSEKGEGLKLKSYFKDLAKRILNIPLIGEVACGTPQLADEDIIEFIAYTGKLNGLPSDYFFLKAKGNSMNNAGIDDGDLLLIKKQNIIPNTNDMAVVLIGNEATVKYLKNIDGVYYLYPKSKDKEYKPIRLLNIDDVIFCGVVKDIIKNN